MDDDGLAAFLRARLDEDEAIAEEAASVAGPAWQHAQAHPTSYLRSTSGAILADTLLCSDGQIGPHLARHDPARVLREVEAGRSILGRHKPLDDASGHLSCAWCSDDVDTASLDMRWPCPDVRDLAAVWSDHPGCRPEWKP